MTLTAEDRLEILELITKADDCATARDPDGYTALFTADAAMTGAMGTATGREALKQAVAEVWAKEPAGTVHLTVNPTIDDAAEEPAVTSVMLMLARDAAGARVLGWANVRQVVRRTGEGWRIASREIRTA